MAGVALMGESSLEAERRSNLGPALMTMRSPCWLPQKILPSAATGLLKNLELPWTPSTRSS